MHKMKEEFQPEIKPLKMWSKKLETDLHAKNKTLQGHYDVNKKGVKA